MNKTPLTPDQNKLVIALTITETLLADNFDRAEQYLNLAIAESGREGSFW